MKLISLIAILYSSIGFSQSRVNQDSLLYHFTFIINEYRKINGLNKIEVDKKLQTLTDYWSKTMGLTGKVGHGEGSESFQSRISRCNCFPPSQLVLENCTELMTPDKPILTSVNTYPDLISYIESSYAGRLNQYEYAKYGFLMWKNSEPHNRSMLNADIKWFYLSSFRNNGRTYLCFIARS
jgi:uncharacterized protein YkwD